MPRSVLLITAAALALSPAAAQPLRYLNPQDVAQAQREHAQILQELGGAETGPRAAYVASVGRRIGVQTGLANPGQALQFTMINSAVENAFSVPGGYIYVTRQLMSLMDDESELAFALGHESAHVAANHARIREQYARRSQYGVLGSILGSIFGDGFFGGMLQQRAKMDALSFSREQEYQADSLALRYLIGAGYDPVGGSEMLAALSRNTALQARMQGRSNRQTPEWAQTHPLSENRMQRMLIEAQATGRLGRGLRNHDAFLAQLRGMYVDDDPAQGVIDGPTFTHPDLRIQFTVPQGYLMSNATDSVTVSGSAGKAQFRGGQFTGQIDQAVLLAFRSLTRGQSNFPVPPPQHVTINGMPAAITTARANGSSGPVDVSVAAYQWSAQQVYYFVMLTPAGSGVGPFAPMINSLRRISPAEAASIRPRVIDVVTVAPGDTVQSLSSRMAYRDFRAERFMSLNGLQPNSRLLPGQKVKLVVYGPRRA